MSEALLGPPPGERPRHSTALLAAIEEAASELGGWQRVDLLAVGVGPGTFTGLRIAIATARALSAALELPASGVCTLDALALGGAGRECLAVLDGRRGEVFAGRYAASGGRLWGPVVCAPQALGERLAGEAAPLLTIGSGALRFRQELARRGAVIPDDADSLHRIAARHICALAAADGAPGPLDPIYLRPPDAERWRDRDAVPQER